MTPARKALSEVRKYLNSLKAELGTEVPSRIYWILEDLHDAVTDLEIVVDGVEATIRELTND